MLAACAARLEQQRDMIWVDLGGGTGVCLIHLARLLPVAHASVSWAVQLFCCLHRSHHLRMYVYHSD